MAAVQSESKTIEKKSLEYKISVVPRAPRRHPAVKTQLKAVVRVLVQCEINGVPQFDEEAVAGMPEEVALTHRSRDSFYNSLKPQWFNVSRENGLEEIGIDLVRLMYHQSANDYLKSRFTSGPLLRDGDVFRLKVDVELLVTPPEEKRTESESAEEKRRESKISAAAASSFGRVSESRLLPKALNADVARATLVDLRFTLRESMIQAEEDEDTPWTNQSMFSVGDPPITFVVQEILDEGEHPGDELYPGPPTFKQSKNPLLFTLTRVFIPVTDRDLLARFGVRRSPRGWTIEV